MKTALITGANRGIGLEFARQYAEDGWAVLACARHESPGLKDLVSKHSGRVRVCRLDVEDHGEIAGLSHANSGLAIDLLIDNAGVYSEKDAKGFSRTDYDEWAKVFRINTMAPLRMAEAFFEQISRGGLRTIVNISSIMGSVSDNSSGGNYLYRSSKAALNMVTKSMAIDLKPAGIISVVFHPGWVRTDMGGPNAAITAEQSVTGMRRVISGLGLADSGRFLDYEGREIPW